MCTGRLLLELVLSDQLFVYHSPDHPVFQSPLPVQHPPSLEQSLLQLCSRPVDLAALSTMAEQLCPASTSRGSLREALGCGAESESHVFEL